MFKNISDNFKLHTHYLFIGIHKSSRALNTSISEIKQINNYKVNPILSAKSFKGL
jgi:hypothetical protein